MRNIDVLVDLQFGSTGKGALAGWLSENYDYDLVVSCNMPNAGHTAYSPDSYGDPRAKFVHKVLPSGIFGYGTSKIGIGPGAIFDIPRLVEEWKNVCAFRDDLTLVIHEAAGILLPEHAEAERNTLSKISSTMQGSAEAMIARIRRKPEAIVKSHMFSIHELLNAHGRAVIVSQDQWLKGIMSCDNILAEGSQGYSLGISAGFYPYCTSRDCTPARVLSDCSLPAGMLRDVYGSCRVHPIRVGNTADGYSGDWYIDQKEIHFSDLGVADERTTVTNRVRRIATFSKLQIEEAMMAAMPSSVFLNFCNYDREAANRAREAIDDAAEKLRCGGVRLLGYGAFPEDIIEV